MITPDTKSIFAAADRAGVAPAATKEQPSQEQLALYQQRLAAHDWFFEYSDDHSVWLSGRAELGQLQSMQRELDPDFAIWNQFAPSDYQRKPK